MYELYTEFGLFWGTVRGLEAALEACRVNNLRIRWR